MGNPLFSTAVPAPMGYQEETFDFPAAQELTDEIAYPETAVTAYRGNTGEVHQESNPEYAGQYLLRFEDAPGTLAPQQSVAPAPGSTDLIAPRNTGEVAGTNRIINSVGPVGGDSEQGNSWSGERSALYQPNPNYSGPVVGGPDYSQTLGAAYYTDAMAGFSEVAATSAMVAAV